jgi:hypothetical protein
MISYKTTRPAREADPQISSQDTQLIREVRAMRAAKSSSLITKDISSLPHRCLKSRARRSGLDTVLRFRNLRTLHPSFQIHPLLLPLQGSSRLLLERKNRTNLRTTTMTTLMKRRSLRISPTTLPKKTKTTSWEAQTTLVE